jgi:hypothetical protein
MLFNTNPKPTGLGLKPVGSQTWVSATNRLINRIISTGWYESEASSRMLDLSIALGIFYANGK